MIPRAHPGYVGMFTRHQMPGAIENSSRVKKVAVEKGDAHPVGARATVLGSISHPKMGPWAISSNGMPCRGAPCS